MQKQPQIPPKPERKLKQGLTWKYEPEINEWVISGLPVRPEPIQSPEEYLSLSLTSLKKAPGLTVMCMSEETGERVKHLFSLSNLKDENILEQQLSGQNVKLGLPLYAEDMLILVEQEI